jgi:hypothetical protein
LRDGCIKAYRNAIATIFRCVATSKLAAAFVGYGRCENKCLFSGVTHTESIKACRRLFPLRRFATLRQ